MILEICITLCVAFFIAVWFYKQRRESIELVQVEFTNAFTTLHELVEEKQPIVIRGCPFPPVLTQEKLAEIPRLNPFPLRIGGPTLQDYRIRPESILPDEQVSGIPILSPAMSRTLAHELVLDRWASHTLKDIFTEFTGLIGLFTSTRVSTILGGHGMKRATAIYTCLLPTQGTYILSLVNKRSESFLPDRWTYRYPDTLSINDTPLVGEVQFIDIIVRPGTMVAVPAHCIYSMKPKEPGFSGCVVIEIDTPISNLASVLERTATV
jgi:hypothetical protein